MAAARLAEGPPARLLRAPWALDLRSEDDPRSSICERSAKAAFLLGCSMAINAPAYADTLCVGVRAYAPDSQHQAAGLTRLLQSDLSTLDAVQGLDKVPLIRSIDGPLTAEDYLRSCSEWDIDLCEVVCGIASADLNVVGGDIRQREGTPVLVIRHTALSSMDTITIEVGPDTAPKDIVSLLRHALTDGGEEDFRHEDEEVEDAAANPEEDITTEDVEGITEAVVQLSKAVDWLGLLDKMSLEELLRESAGHGMTPNEYRDWRTSDLGKQQFLRMRRGRKGRLEFSANQSLLAGVVAPSYAGSLTYEEGTSEGSTSVSYGLDSGIGGETTVAVAYGFAETLSARLSAGVASSDSYIWLDGTADGQATHYHHESITDAGWRLSASAGVVQTLRPMSKLHPTAGLELSMMRLPAIATIPSTFPAASAFAFGPRVRLGFSGESETGMEVRGFLTAGTWQGARIVRTGSDEGPAGWSGYLPFYGGLGIEVAAAGLVLGTNSSQADAAENRKSPFADQETE